MAKQTTMSILARAWAGWVTFRRPFREWYAQREGLPLEPDPAQAGKIQGSKDSFGSLGALIARVDQNTTHKISLLDREEMQALLMKHRLRKHLAKGGLDAREDAMKGAVLTIKKDFWNKRFFGALTKLPLLDEKGQSGKFIVTPKKNEDPDGMKFFSKLTALPADQIDQMLLDRDDWFALSFLRAALSDRPLDRDQDLSDPSLNVTHQDIETIAVNEQKVIDFLQENSEILPTDRDVIESFKAARTLGAILGGPFMAEYETIPGLCPFETKSVQSLRRKLFNRLSEKTGQSREWADIKQQPAKFYEAFVSYHRMFDSRFNEMLAKEEAEFVSEYDAAEAEERLVLKEKYQSRMAQRGTSMIERFDQQPEFLAQAIHMWDRATYDVREIYTAAVELVHAKPTGLTFNERRMLHYFTTALEHICPQSAPTAKAARRRMPKLAVA